MKNYKLPLAALLVASAMWGCQKEDPMLFSDVDRIILADTFPKSHTFGYDTEDVTRAEVMIKVGTMGQVVDYDRPVELVQVAPRGLDAGMINAVKGTHFEFDRKAEWVVKAGETSALLPVTLLRSGDLRDKVAVLRLSVAANDEFEVGAADNKELNVEFSDRLLKPDFWGDAGNQYGPVTITLGYWSENKMRFMFQTLGEPIDEAWFEKFNGIPGAGNQYLSMLQNALVEYNTANAPDVLEDGKGNPVSFTMGGF